MIKQNVSLPQGDTLTILFNVSNPDGAATDLTGATIRWWMGATPPTSNVHVMKDNQATGGVATTGTAGQFAVSISEADTLTVSPGTYYHEAEVRLTDGTVATVASGQFTITATLIPGL